jgi:hypothetical protein
MTSQDFSSADFYTREVSIDGNNSMFMQEDLPSRKIEDYQRDLRGARVEYNVDVSKVDSGCVAGVYLVETNDGYCSNKTREPGQTAQCSSIDVMQANKFGFESKAHPCTNGTCDSVSRCSASMHEQG